MITWETLEDAVRTWVVAATGLAADRVYFADQDLPTSEASPRVSIRLGDLVQIGQDSFDHDYDPGRPAGQEIEIKAKGMRTLAVDLQSFAPTTVGAGTTARSVLAAAQAALSLPSVRTTLNAAGLGLLEQGTVQRIPSNALSQVEDRATLSVRFCVAQSITERTGYIETVVAIYGGGPVLQMVGAEDVARFAILDRWARTDQPSFPRLVDGPRGRPGVQFTRAGAVLSGTNPVGMGHYREERADVSSVLRLISSEMTFSTWIRFDPFLPVAGEPVTVLLRPFTIAGASDGSALPNQQAVFGLNVNPTTGVLTLVQQTPSSLGAGAVLGRSSAYTLGLPLPTSWRHLAVTVRRNGLDVPPFEIGATAEWFLDGASVFSQVGDGAVASGPRIPQWALFPAPRYAVGVGAQWLDLSTIRAFGRGFDGAIADLAIYPRALSPAEITTLYTTGPFGLRV